MTIGNARSYKDNKQACYERGELMEQHFIENVVPRLRVNGGQSLYGEINPEKAGDKYADDLLFTGQIQQRVELKSMTTPFFLSRQMFGYSPQATFTLNVSDLNQMEDKLDIFKDDPLVFLYVLFEQATLDQGKKEFGVNSINPIEGVWAITLDGLLSYVYEHTVPVHAYKERKKGNAKRSYVLNLVEPCFYRMVLMNGGPART